MYAPSFSHTEAHSAPLGTPRAVPVDLGVVRDFRDHNAESVGNWVIHWKSAPARQLPAASRLAVCMDYMLAHLHQPMRISTLSTMAGLSASRFFELFKHATGDTPLNWFIRARMKWAGELLVRSSLPIKQIAGQVGYEDQFYFSRLFKSVHGIAPTAYRIQRGSTPLSSSPPAIPRR